MRGLTPETFYITEPGDITWDDFANAAVAPVWTSGSYNSGAMGLAFIRASDGVMIASEAARDANPFFDVDGLGLTNDGVAYYLEAVDTYSGGWGYVEWDNISIPGTLVPEPSALAFLGLGALGLIFRRRRK